MLPGAWGLAQSGVADFFPSADDDGTYWLHSIPLQGAPEMVELRLSALGEGRLGSGVVVAALTLFAGTADPLVLGPRREFVIEGFGQGLPEVDLGLAIQSRQFKRPTAKGPGIPVGWGTSRSDRAVDGTERSVIDIVFAPDARLRFGDWDVAAAELTGPAVADQGNISIRPLAPPDVRVDITIISGEGKEPTPARVRFRASDGRYLPPLGHRAEVNPGISEDTGADMILGRDTYAYVSGKFQIDLPVGTVEVEVVKGFDHRPVSRAIVVDPAVRRFEFVLERPIDLRSDGWLTADSHVHFLAPSTAVLQAAAEDLAFVHLLATQWGDHFTNVMDLMWGSNTDPSGQHAVIVGTENRHALLGHLALLGARHQVLPMSTGGAPEGRIGGVVTELLADWADRCHSEGDLVVAAHFPLPYAEIAADIVTGRIDAVEMMVFSPGLNNPSVLEWYRYLNCGYRLPVIGGTDKMSAEIPVGAVRTYARLDPEAPPSFESWAAAVRAGRTFATSGPVIELSVDGHEPGDVLSLPASGGRLDARVRVRSAQAVISSVEVVVNGRVVATRESPHATDNLTLQTPIDIRAGAWIAARSRSDHEIHSAFRTSMASHTSPVYVEVQDRPIFVPDDARAILAVIEGTERWVRTMATIDRPAERQRMVQLIAESASTLRDRIGRASREGL